MGVFNDTAQRTNGVFQTASLGPVTGFGENFEAGLDAFLKADLVVSEDRNLKVAYAPIISALAERGVWNRYVNPYDQTPTNQLGRRDQYRAETTGRIWDEVDKIKKSDPTFLSDGPMNHDDLTGKALTGAREASERFVDVNTRASLSGDIGGFAGQAYGALHDPAVQLTLPFGAARGATILKTALVESLVAGTTEAAIQPFIQDYREKAGLPHGVDVALANVLTATIAGGVFGAGVKGLQKAFGAKFGDLERILDMTDEDLMIGFDSFIRARDAFDPNGPAAKDILEFLPVDDVVRLADEFDAFLVDRAAARGLDDPLAETGARFGEMTEAEAAALFPDVGDIFSSKAPVAVQKDFLLERFGRPAVGVSPEVRSTFKEMQARTALDAELPAGATRADFEAHDQNMRFMTDTLNQGEDVVGDVPWTPRADMVPDDELVSFGVEADILYDDMFGEAVPARATPDFVEVVGDDGNVARMAFGDVKTEIDTSREFLAILEACK